MIRLRNLVWLIILGLFIVEGTIIPWVTPGYRQSVLVASPHLVFVMVLFIGVYSHRYSALAYGLIFGMLQDVIYYGHMLGTHSFSMGLLGYLAGLLARRAKAGLTYIMFIMFTGNLAYEWIIYGLYRLFRISHLELGWAVMHLMLPSVLVNLLIALLMYAPARRLLEGGRPVSDNEED